MTTDDSGREPPQEDAFETEARKRPRSMLLEIGAFLRATKAYWLTPIVLLLVVFAGLLALSGTAAAPFVYTLF